MKRGLFLLATVTLCSALYAQEPLSLEQARALVAKFNPQLLEQASSNEGVNALLEQMLASYVSSNPSNTLENRFTLVALARNFDNSIVLNAALEQYKNALRYSQAGGNVLPAAEQAATTLLAQVYPRIWAVSVQVKNALLGEYKQAQSDLRRDNTLPAQEKSIRLHQLQQSAESLQADLRQLQTNTGEQLLALTQGSLAQARVQVAQELAALQTELQATQATNLQIKSNHKKPVAK